MCALRRRKESSFPVGLCERQTVVVDVEEKVEKTSASTFCCHAVEEDVALNTVEGFFDVVEGDV